MAKYKFRLSYKTNEILTPIKLEDLEELKDIDITDIKEIDKFTTKYENKETLLNDLKEKKLIPEDVTELYITFDKKEGKNTIQQLYSFNKTIFYSNERDKLKTSYAYSLIRNHIDDGEFMQNIIKYYINKYPHKNFSIIDGVSYNLKNYGAHGLSPSEYREYVDEVEYFMEYIFYKKNKDGIKEKKYRKVRDFLCYIKGETPIRIKTDTPKPKKVVKESVPIIKEEIKDDIDDDREEFITYKEYQEFNKEFISSCKEEDFEPYQDGNDWISPITRREKYSSLNSSVKKLMKRKDNGEYE